MINSDYPLCIECEKCDRVDGAGKQRGQEFFYCKSDETSTIDVVTGKVFYDTCENQRKDNTLHRFGINDITKCGLQGQYFKKKIV